MTSSDEGKELSLLFQVYINDIRYSKQQQWNTIYLTLVAIGATVVLFISTKHIISHWFLRGLVIFIPSFISWLGITYLLNYQLDIAKYRYMKDRILEKAFSPIAQELAKEPEWYKKVKGYSEGGLSARDEFKRDFLCFFVPFSVVILLALILITFIVKMS